MKKLAWSAFVAFWTAVFTLLAVFALLPESRKQPTPQTPKDGAETESVAETVRYNEDGLRIITLEELAQHSTAESCWKAIHGKVYDVTEYIDLHPTPREVMLEWCGRESTAAYDDKGDGTPHSMVADMMLEDVLVGVLEE